MTLADCPDSQSVSWTQKCFAAAASSILAAVDSTAMTYKTFAKTSELMLLLINDIEAGIMFNRAVLSDRAGAFVYNAKVKLRTCLLTLYSERSEGKQSVNARNAPGFLDQGLIHNQLCNTDGQHNTAQRQTGPPRTLHGLQR